MRSSDWSSEVCASDLSVSHSMRSAATVEGEEGGRMRYPTVGAERMLWLTDPDLGDRLVVVPIRGAGLGLALPYGLPQFRSLPTQQGIVLQPLTSGIEVAGVSSGVLVRDHKDRKSKRLTSSHYCAYRMPSYA